MSNLKDECARRNAKLVANHLINDTCLNAPKWPHKPTYTHWLIRNSGPWPTWVNKGLAKQWPQIILQPAPQLHPDTQGAHPSRRDKDRAPLRQTAAGPYGGVPHRVWDYRYTVHATHTHLTQIIAYSICMCMCTGTQHNYGAWESVSCTQRRNIMS